MNYRQGYVAFIDILGFSNFVENNQNALKVNDIFEFVGRFQYLFNTSSKLNTQVAFFSDSIILSTDDDDKSLNMLFWAIYLAEIYLREQTGLFFRGGITKGYYYHNGSIAFGPAIVSAYRLENKATYSRILIDQEVIAELDDLPLAIMQDIDGNYCFNPYIITLLNRTNDQTGPTKEDILKSLEEERESLCRIIDHNIYTTVAEKYLWRINPYNKTCDKLLIIFRELGLVYSQDDVNKINELKITLKDFEHNI